MKTKVTDLFGIKHPIICGGMLWVTDPKLCAAISNAGGLGALTACQYNSGDELRGAIRETRELTDKPIGVNITLMPSFRITEEIYNDFFRVCAEEHVANIEISGRFADAYIPMLHDNGVKITHKVGAVRHAQKIERLGYDAVIAAGVEEGGHPLIDNVATTVLCAKIAESVSIPVIAAGGIVDGKSMAAALALGADGVMMATRFMLSSEAPVHEQIQQHICSRQENDTVLFCKSFLQARALKNGATDKAIALEYAGAGIKEVGDVIAGYRLRKALAEGDVDGAAFFVGQSIGRIDSVKSCAEIIESMMAECRETAESVLAKF